VLERDEELRARRRSRRPRRTRSARAPWRWEPSACARLEPAGSW